MKKIKKFEDEKKLKNLNKKQIYKKYNKLIKIRDN